MQIGFDSPPPPGRVLHFGGSFNPVHKAHLQCCAAAARAAGFGTVVLVPTGQPLLKIPDYRLASAADRRAMLKRAIADQSGAPVFRVDPIELHRVGPSYTIDTVTELRARGEREVHWLIGADQLVNFHRWHRYQELLQLARFWVMARPGYAIDWPSLDPLVQGLADHVVTVPQMDISATEIRRRVAAGEPIDTLVPSEVRKYIEAHRLYIPQP